MIAVFNQPYLLSYAVLSRHLSCNSSKAPDITVASMAGVHPDTQVKRSHHHVEVYKISLPNCHQLDRSYLRSFLPLLSILYGQQQQPTNQMGSSMKSLYFW